MNTTKQPKRGLYPFGYAVIRRERISRRRERIEQRRAIR
jgi:hypothetical protein